MPDEQTDLALPRSAVAWGSLASLALGVAEGALFVAAFSFRGSEGLLNVAFLLSLLGVVPAIVMLVGNKGGPGSYRWAAATGLVLPLLVIVAYVALIIALMNALGY